MYILLFTCTCAHVHMCMHNVPVIVKLFLSCCTGSQGISQCIPFIYKVLFLRDHLISLTFLSLWYTRIGPFNL